MLRKKAVLITVRLNQHSNLINNQITDEHLHKCAKEVCMSIVLPLHDSIPLECTIIDW